MTHPGYPHPDYDRPADTRPGRDLLDTRVGRAVLAVMVAYVAIAIPVVVLRCVWQFSPLAAVGIAAIGALYINQKVSNR